MRAQPDPENNAESLTLDLTGKRDEVTVVHRPQTTVLIGIS